MVRRVPPTSPDRVGGDFDGLVDEGRPRPPTSRSASWDCCARDMGPHRVEEHAPDVELTLVVGAVTDPDRLGVSPTAEVVEEMLAQVALPVDAVHDLQVRL